MPRRRVAITGLGMVTPFGVGTDVFWDGLVSGRCAVRPAVGLDLGDMPATRYGQIPPFDFDDYLDPQAAAFWSMASRLAVTGGILARRDAGEPSFAPDRTGVLLGTGYGCMWDFEPLYDTWFKRGWKRLKPVSVPKNMPNAPASHLAIDWGARGLNATISTACSSGAVAAGLAAEHIREGRLDACVTGGLDYIMSASIVGAWNALRVLSRRDDDGASAPFSSDRDGLVLAEGCAIVVLEEMEAARARGARIYAEITGVGANNDAANIVGPDAEGEVTAMRLALADAGLRPADIGYVNAHGTATQANDANETEVLRTVFDGAPPPVSSIKGHVGHTMGAAGALDLAATALALHHQTLPPTLHWKDGDPVCTLDYVPHEPRKHAFRHAMTNSFGFGGQNSVLTLSSPDY